MGVESGKRAAFFAALQANFDAIFGSEDASAAEVFGKIKAVV